MKQLKHTNIVEFKDVFQIQEEIYIVIEYIRYGDVSDLISSHISKGEPFNETDIMDYLKQICLALKNIHRNNIIHRDLKPANILLDKDKENGQFVLKLTDFGISKKVDHTQETDTICGSPAYKAPEIYEPNIAM